MLKTMYGDQQHFQHSTAHKTRRVHDNELLHVPVVECHQKAVTFHAVWTRDNSIFHGRQVMRAIIYTHDYTVQYLRKHKNIIRFISLKFKKKPRFYIDFTL